MLTKQTIKKYKWVPVVYAPLIILIIIFTVTHLQRYNILATPSLQKTVTAKKDVAKNIDGALKEQHFSGTALVVQNGRVLLNKGYGYSNEQTKHRNDSRTLYNIASIQKNLTALMAVRLINEKKLSYQTPISKYYPNIPDGKNITVRSLLTMTSGLSTTSEPEHAMNEADTINYYTHHVKKTNTLGSWDYDAINYKILAGIIVRITHKSYSENFKQLYLKQLHLGFKEYPNFKDSETSLSYHEGGKPFSNAKYIYTNEVGTGSIFATSGDFYKYVQMMVNGQVLNKEQLNPMYKLKQGSDYASGFYVNPKYKRSHGVLQGYEPTVITNNNAQNAVILMSNRAGDRQTVIMANSFFALINNVPYFGGNSY